MAGVQARSWPGIAVRMRRRDSRSCVSGARSARFEAVARGAACGHRRRIREHAVAWAMRRRWSPPHRSDQHLPCIGAMHEAVSQLVPAADHLLIDAMKLNLEVPQKSIIHGDALLRVDQRQFRLSAKVERDRHEVCKWDTVSGIRLAEEEEERSSGFSTVWQESCATRSIWFMQDEAEQLFSFPRRWRSRWLGKALKSLQNVPFRSTILYVQNRDK